MSFKMTHLEVHLYIYMSFCAGVCVIYFQKQSGVQLEHKDSKCLDRSGFTAFSDGC